MEAKYNGPASRKPSSGVWVLDISEHKNSAGRFFLKLEMPGKVIVEFRAELMFHKEMKGSILSKSSIFIEQELNLARIYTYLEGFGGLPRWWPRTH